MAQIKTKRERVKFASDNVTGACPEVLDAILKANVGDRTPYGNDEISKSLQDKFNASYKDIPDEKFEEVLNFIEFLKKNPN